MVRDGDDERVRAVRSVVTIRPRRDGIDAARLLADLRGIAFSLGSACASGSGRPSHVLRALGLDYREARSSIRLGFGRYTKVQELTDACHQIVAAVKAQEHLVA